VLDRLSKPIAQQRVFQAGFQSTKSADEPSFWAKSTEALLEVYGASFDARALPLLKKRLHEEERRATTLEAQGYIRMREKCEQLVPCLKPLIEALEGMGHVTSNDTLETQY